MPRHKNITDRVANESNAASASNVISFEQQKELLLLQEQIVQREAERIALFKRNKERLTQRETERRLAEAQIKLEEDKRIERAAQLKREELQMQLELARLHNSNNSVKQENDDERQGKASDFNVIYCINLMKIMWIHILKCLKKWLHQKDGHKINSVQ